jgi:hypothetical protein
VVDGKICWYSLADGSGECFHKAYTHASWCDTSSRNRIHAKIPGYAGPYQEILEFDKWIVRRYCTVDANGVFATYSPGQWEEYDCIPMYLPSNTQFPCAIELNGVLTHCPTKHHAPRTRHAYTNLAKFVYDRGIKFIPGTTSANNFAEFLQEQEKNTKIKKHIEILTEGELRLNDITIKLDKRERGRIATALFNHISSCKNIALFDHHTLRE